MFFQGWFGVLFILGLFRRGDLFIIILVIGQFGGGRLVVCNYDRQFILVLNCRLGNFEFK